MSVFCELRLTAESLLLLQACTPCCKRRKEGKILGSVDTLYRVKRIPSFTLSEAFIYALLPPKDKEKMSIYKINVYFILLYF